MALQCFFTIVRARDRYGVAMKLALSAALLALASVPALADDDPPGYDDLAPPSSVDPAAAPQPPPPAPTPEQRWGCHGSWRWHHGTYASRFAIGIGHGHYELDGDEGHQKSLFARIGLHHGFEIELEMARTELDRGDQLRTGGAALVKTFGHRHFRPYLLAGAGGGRLEPASGDDTHLHYGELGFGLMLRGRHLGLALDMRRGVRGVEDDAMTTTAKMTQPTDEETREHYTRGRILALVYF